jgi:hypothetical protein
MMAARKKALAMTATKKMMAAPVFTMKRKLVKAWRPQVMPPLPPHLGVLECCYDLNQFMTATADWMASVQRAIWGGSEEVPPPPPKWPPR